MTRPHTSCSLALADRRLRGYVAHIDEQIGRILGALSELGLWDTTCIAFTADHGELTGSHRLHDKGPAVYDDIYRIPGILRVPDGPRGHPEARFTSLLEFTASIIDIAGLAANPEADGASVLPLAHGRAPAAWRDVIVSGRRRCTRRRHGRRREFGVPVR